METQQDMMEIDSVDDNTRKSDDGIGKSNSNKTGNSPLSANNEISLSSALSSYLADAKFSSDSPNTSGLQRSNATKKNIWSFTAKDRKKEIVVSKPNVDIDSVRKVYRKLRGIERANDAFVSSLELLSINIGVHLNIMKQIHSTLDVNVFIIVMENPDLHSPEYLQSALPEFCKSLAELPEEATVQLIKWWSEYSEEQLRTMVQCIQQLLTYKVQIFHYFSSYYADDLKLEYVFTNDVI